LWQIYREIGVLERTQVWWSKYLPVDAIALLMLAKSTKGSALYRQISRD
jgi:hypothetical protein